MGKNVIFTSLTILYFFIYVVTSLNSSTDEYALLAFKYQITSDPNKILAKNWSQGTSFCNWIGITCGTRHQRVRGLNLANMGLGGTIAKEIGGLSFLRSLVISNNNFHGFIPDEMGKLSQLREIEMQYNELNGNIPTSLGFLENLKKLCLSHNRFNGNIPNGIFNLSSLIEINLTNNSLSGSLPTDICYNLPKLEMLKISVNQISGDIPPSLGTCTNLNRLSLSYNNFAGSIPMEIGNLSKLEVLYLAKNNLIGDLPSTIFNITSLLQISVGIGNKISGKFPEDLCNRATMLKTFEISGNKFHGEIPPSLLQCHALQNLDISNNDFTGNIPNEIGNLSTLQGLYLGINGLSGRVPYSIGSLSNLKILSISINSLHGQIPESIFNLSMLQVLEFENNSISGNLPSSIANGLPNLKDLLIGWNRLSGEIPGCISNFSKLIKLDLSKNSFSGRVPMNLGNLQSLRLLNFGGNQLTNDPSMLELDFLISLINCRQLKKIHIGTNSFDGMLPRALGNLSASIEVFNADFCGIKGIIPNEIGNMSNLIQLDIGGNELTGTIPDTLGQLINMQMLRLNDNNIQGSINVNLCNLVNLYHLDLGNNHLSRQLPTCLGNLTSLRELNLSYNSLTFTIPSTLWTNKEIQIMDLSYNLFNGSLAPEIGSVKAMRELYLSRNQFSGEIPSTIGQLQSLVNLTLSNNRLHAPILESLGDLISLQYLDLSKNNLYGEIPRSLEKLKELVYFNVSFNELSGEIPNGGPFKNLTADFFIGNSKLCGASQYNVMPCKGNATSSSSKTRILKYILPSIALVIILAIILVYLMRCHNRNTLLPTQCTSPTTIKRISYYEVLNATNKFGEENLIGIGSIGSVYKGIFSDGMIAAIKVFNLDLEGANMSFDTECRTLCKIHHRNIVKVITSCSNIDLKALVLEYMPNGNLNKWLSSSNCFLNIVQRLQIMIDVASALEYLHHGYPSPIVHCDLKPNNILLDEDMVAHVADFGIAKLFTEDQRISLTKTLGTIGYMAPEYGSTGLISTMADVYSFGIMLMETFTKMKPTDDMFVGEFTMRRWVFESFPNAITQIVDVDLMNAVENNDRAEESCFRSIMGLALECTADFPEQRLSAKDVLTRLKKIKTEFF
ncbi:LRR receptor-like serine/threonine-protein kinase FLS2 [Forsythia ovata]|uniref:non-specific serine/threonine protein kinase n=1 Tax=Forsythia ovata TaxID=205694 RepID=A0ABD1SAK8_9LAMI